MSLETYLPHVLKSHVVNARLSKDEYDWVKKIATKHQTTLTHVIRALVTKEMAENESQAAL